MQKLNANGVGKSFFVYKYKHLDIALPRSEKQTGTLHKNFTVQIETDFKKACERRDFTINSMLYSIEDDVLLDFFGGVQDLQHKILRATNSLTFKEDSLRALRCLQFAARFGFKVEKNTVNICNELDLSNLSSHRIWVEFEKLFNAKYQNIGFLYLFKLGIAKKLFNLSDTKNILKAIRFIKHSKTHKLLIPFTLRQFFYLPYNKSLQHAPKEWQKEASLQIKKPKIVTDKFLAGLSLKIAPQDWLGGNFSGDKTDFGINSSKVIAEGYSGKDISKQIKLQRSEYIRKNF